MNISSLCSPIHMSTPTDVANKVQRKRLSKGRGRVTTPKEARNPNAKKSPGYQKARSNKSPLAARNANIQNTEIENTSHKVEPIVKPTQPHQTQSKSRFRNLLADSDSDTESEAEIQDVQVRSQVLVVVRKEVHWIPLVTIRSLVTTSIFLCTTLIDNSVKKFGYNEHPPAMSSFFFIFLLVSETQCKYFFLIVRAKIVCKT